jgi:hypothetical protein
MRLMQLWEHSVRNKVTMAGCTMMMRWVLTAASYQSMASHLGRGDVASIILAIVYGRAAQPASCPSCHRDTVSA